ncbi:ImcF-related family protein [Cronobacter turicensis]
MDTSGNKGHWSGRFGFIIAVLAGIAWGIYRFGDRIGLDSFRVKLYVFLGLCAVIFLLRFGAQIILFFNKQNDVKETSASSHKAAAPIRKSPYSDTLSDLKQALRYQYGRCWRHKITFLMLTGSATDVEYLAPGLSTQYWQEDQGTVLLWGGDIDMPLDSDWFSGVQELRYRPVDAMVWVTSAFDQFATLSQPVKNSSLSLDQMDSVSSRIGSRFELLGWKLPLYIWSVSPGSLQKDRIIQPVGYLLPARARPADIDIQLKSLCEKLTAQGIQQICVNPEYTYLLDLNNQLSQSLESISTPLSVFLNPYRPLPLVGMMFSPSAAEATREIKHHWGRDNRWDLLLSSMSELSAEIRARKQRPGLWSVLRILVIAGMIGWGAWMIIAYVTNRSVIDSANAQAALAARENQPLAQRLHALSELQRIMAHLQYRAEHSVPWYEQAGLSQNDTLLTALWPRYRDSALPLLRDAAATQLQQQLTAFEQLPPDSPQREMKAKASYDQLKLYLMLARPERMDAAWFGPALLRAWPQRDGVSDGVWQGSAPSLLSFYGANLAAHPQWRLPADEEMINQVRSLLIRLMGMRNSESSLYQKMLSQVEHLYVDMRLEDMTGDTDASRLFTDAEVVPGMFTRQAWEQAIQPAIENVVKERRDEMDWVLTDSKQAPQGDGSPEALKKQLTERYFADFGGAWLGFLNALRWQQAATLSDAIDQLTLMADVRQSPLVALMNTLNIQGRTGQTGEAISDSLVKSAKNLLSNENSDAIDQSAGPHGPLDATFGPVLALMDKNHTGEQAQSLQAYLSRVTQVRLRLQQVTNAADPQAMTQTLAQTVFQGKAIDLTETRDYGSLIAAGLGQEWNGFGRTVFVQPMEEAWQQVLAPAADSLNVQWQQAVVSDWNEAFGGRYPFNNSDSDVSLPLLAKYLNADSGRIAQFLQTRLKGVLHREGSHWAPDSVNAQGLTFNPAFLTAINTLSNISDVAFTEGNAGMSFELRPGTADGVMQTDMIIDHQKLNYVNQMPQWKRFTWPADTDAPGATLSWISTQAGTRQYADMPGAWGWIRLLDEASVAPYPGIDSSYSLRWKAQDGRYLNYTLRTVAGEGPLVLLKLRHFRLPETIFSVDASQASSEMDDRKEAD